MKAKHELADVIHRFGSELMAQNKLSPIQIKTLNDLLQCRTASLGGHEQACDYCGTIHYNYNSCGNRHCPKCLLAKQLKWIEKLKQRTLPIRHYHIIFTVPHELNTICLWNQKLYYSIMFRAMWHTLRSFGYSHYGVESGAVAILHTWGQNISLHPHLHCLVPAAGYSLKGQWKNIGVKGLYLYPVHQLSNSFKYKMLALLKHELIKQGAYSGFYKAIQQAYNKAWNVHCEPSFAKAKHVIQYLGQYTHRVAIANTNITKITNTHVHFMTKDYRDRAKKKPAKLKGVEFLKRFCMHVLPKGFVKIRHYGIYNSTTKRNLKLVFKPNTIEESLNAKDLKNETAVQAIKRLLNIDVCLCPVCKKGTLVTIKELPRIRSPNNRIQHLLLRKVM